MVMKRKRSVDNVFNRPMDNDEELKRAMHHKLNNKTGMQADMLRVSGNLFSYHFSGVMMPF